MSTGSTHEFGSQATRSFVEKCLDWAVLLAVVTGGVTMAWTYWPARQAPAIPIVPQTISIENAATRGQTDATVVMVQYSEFQCPYCKVFGRDIMPALDAKYVNPGKLLVAFRHFPLDSVHKAAVHLGAVAECARKSGSFWKVHDFLFSRDTASGSSLQRDDIIRLGMNPDVLEACSQHEGEASVLRDRQEGVSLGVEGTPTFFFALNEATSSLRVEERLAGAQPVETFSRVIELLLDRAQSRHPVK